MPPWIQEQTESSTANQLLSPSLLVNAAAPSYEVKFILQESEAQAVEKLLKATMVLDNHGQAVLHGCYEITSLYFDTVDFAVFHRREGFQYEKHRLRRYGNEALVYLEKKTRFNQRVQKVRSAVALEDVPGEMLSQSRSGFGAELQDRKLVPVCKVTYLRKAYIGSSLMGPIRVTFDRSLRGSAETQFCVDPVLSATRLFDSETIVEFKFLAGMPAFFKQVMEQCRLIASPGSKYRSCISTLGLQQHKEAD